MADKIDILAGAGVFGGAIAAFLTALGWRKPGDKPPEKGNDTMAVLERRIEALEGKHTELRNVVLVLVEQQRRAEVDREEANRARAAILDQMQETRECLARIEGRLE